MSQPNTRRSGHGSRAAAQQPVDNDDQDYNQSEEEDESCSSADLSISSRQQNGGAAAAAASRPSSTSTSIKAAQRWSPEEHELLSQVVARFGNSRKWSEIAKHVPGRTGKQCRERWVNHMNPDIKKGAWDVAEELLLCKWHSILGSHWARITKKLEGRTENAVKNHWNAAQRAKHPSRRQTPLNIYVHHLKAGVEPSDALVKVLEALQDTYPDLVAETAAAARDILYRRLNTSGFPANAAAAAPPGGGSSGAAGAAAVGAAGGSGGLTAAALPSARYGEASRMGPPSGLVRLSGQTGSGLQHGYDDMGGSSGPGVAGSANRARGAVATGGGGAAEGVPPSGLLPAAASSSQHAAPVMKVQQLDGLVAAEHSPQTQQAAQQCLGQEQLPTAAAYPVTPGSTSGLARIPFSMHPARLQEGQYFQQQQQHLPRHVALHATLASSEGAVAATTGASGAQQSPEGAAADTPMPDVVLSAQGSSLPINDNSGNAQAAGISMEAGGQPPTAALAVVPGRGEHAPDEQPPAKQARPSSGHSAASNGSSTAGHPGAPADAAPATPANDAAAELAVGQDIPASSASQAAPDLVQQQQQQVIAGQQHQPVGLAGAHHSPGVLSSVSQSSCLLLSATSAGQLQQQQQQGAAEGLVYGRSQQLQIDEQQQSADAVMAKAYILYLDAVLSVETAAAAVLQDMDTPEPNIPQQQQQHLQQVYRQASIPAEQQLQHQQPVHTLAARAAASGQLLQADAAPVIAYDQCGRQRQRHPASYLHQQQERQQDQHMAPNGAHYAAAGINSPQATVRLLNMQSPLDTQRHSYAASASMPLQAGFSRRQLPPPIRPKPLPTQHFWPQSITTSLQPPYSQHSQQHYALMRSQSERIPVDRWTQSDSPMPRTHASLYSPGGSVYPPGNRQPPYSYGSPYASMEPHWEDGGHQHVQQQQLQWPGQPGLDSVLPGMHPVDPHNLPYTTLLARALSAPVVPQQTTQSAAADVPPPPTSAAAVKAPLAAPSAAAVGLSASQMPAAATAVPNSSTASAAAAVEAALQQSSNAAGTATAAAAASTNTAALAGAVDTPRTVSTIGGGVPAASQGSPWLQSLELTGHEDAIDHELFKDLLS
eukprot:GHRR01002439.1.p1 GENE.GHRR01002439.1~~GHRR01002439.1.p1  ORF type:complete len:1108 (+),score=578.17 GHRR01002439.1:1014-4337(+)